MYCNKCGTEISDDSLFCYKCGAKLLGLKKAPKEDTPDILPKTEEIPLQAPQNTPFLDNTKGTAVSESAPELIAEECVLSSGEEKAKFNIFEPLLPKKKFDCVFLVFVIFFTLLFRETFAFKALGFYVCAISWNIVIYFWKRKAPLKAAVTLIFTLLVMGSFMFYYEKNIQAPTQPIRNGYSTIR